MGGAAIILCAIGVTGSIAARPSLPVEIARPVSILPHDPGAFTEGLIYRDGFLYESTGRKGRSSIRKVDPGTGQAISSVDIPDGLFGEGLADWGDQLVSVTWHGGLGFRWSLERMRIVGMVHYAGEGWGLARTDRALVLSDGSARLRFLDPQSFAVVRTLRVTARGHSVRMLNELEYVRGEILANIWMSNRIARIDPADGHVKGWIDLGPIVKTLRLRDHDAVANGIAYDAAGGRLFVTGKYWPSLFELRPPADGG